MAEWQPIDSAPRDARRVAPAENITVQLPEGVTFVGMLEEAQERMQLVKAGSLPEPPTTKGEGA